MANDYITRVEGTASGPRKWDFVRPTTVPWDDFGVTVRPILGQPLRIRECMTIGFQRISFTDDATIWLDRPRPESFLGHFQITRLQVGTTVGGDTGAVVTQRGQLIGYQSSVEDVYTWFYEREYDLNFHLTAADEYAALATVILNCNADLSPGPVPNNFLTPANIEQYIRIAYGLATNELANAATLIQQLTSPYIAGYRFSDDVLFNALTNLPTLDLADTNLVTRLQNISLWVHPDYSVIPMADYTVQIVNFLELAESRNQYPELPICNYPGDAEFPPL